jgi:hypothetical protein
MPQPSCCKFSDIKPLRLLIMLSSVATFAASVPQEPVKVGLMTPVYHAAPAIYGW